MGVSTDAYLYFGVDVLDDEEGYGPKAWIESDQKDEDGYEEYFGDWIDQQNLEGVDSASHCSSTYPIHFIYTTMVRASRGYPEKIRPEGMQESPEDRTTLEKALDKLGMPELKEKIGWYLASYTD